MTDRDSPKIPRIPELEEDYELIRELGRGGTAVVYLARERALGRDVAIKLISPTHVRDADSVARLIREAQTVGKLQHPNIVMLLGTRRLGDGGLALILQYVPGRTLKERIRTEGPVPPLDAEKILRDVGQALAYAHRQRIVHRDIKPENVYLDDGCDLARLADFGIARAWDSDSGLTLPGTAIGTPSYMSPEQVDGKELDGRSDVYALGLLGYEMLTGRQPWAGESLYTVIYKQKHEELLPISEACPEIPENLRVAIEGALRKRREGRWPNAEAFLEALSRGSALPPEEDDLPELPVSEEAEGEDAAEEGRAEPWDGELEEQHTIRYVRPGGRGGAGRTAGAEPGASEDRRSSLPVAILIVAALMVGGLGLEALVAGPEGYARSLFGYFTPVGDDGEEGPPGAGEEEPGLWGTAQPRGDVDGAPPLEGPEAVSLEGLLEREGMGEPPGDPSLDVPEGVADAPGPGAPAGGVAAAASILRGTGQEGTVEGVLPQPLELLVMDGEGEPLPGVVVRFEIQDGGGRVDPAAALSDGEGIARGIWTLGPEPGGQAVTATVEGPREVTARFAARAALARLPVRAGVATGGTHSCTLRAEGSLLCWGANSAGQLGDGSFTGRITAAAPVPGSPFAVLTSGMSHVCALDLEGRAFCWGANDEGQLGVSGLPRRAEPGPVAGSLHFSDVAAGAAHTCGITRAGAAFCWGGNESGQLGDGTRERRSEPVRVRSERVFRQIAAGWRHTCAVDDGGVAHCWGANASGELGSGGGASPQPRPVGGGHRFRSLAAGASHTCGVREDGVVLCWGSNEHGRLGDGTGESRAQPTPVAAGERFRQVVAGASHTCAITTDDQAFCWGRNPYGQVGDGSTADRDVPVPVTGGRRFTVLHAFGSHTCGRSPGGEILCWGYNVDGQLGDGSRENRAQPTLLSGGRP